MDIKLMYGVIFTILFNVAPLFQMVRIVRSGCSDNNSYGLWICGIFGQLCVLGYCYEHDIRGVFNYINSIMGMILNIIMIILIYCYRSKKSQ